MAGEVCEDKTRNNNNIVSSSSTGFGYSAMQTHLVNDQIQQGFDSNPDIFNLATGMEMIGLSKNLHQQQADDTNSTVMWKGFFNKPSSSSSSSKPIIDESTTDFYQNEFHKPDDDQFITTTESAAPWQDNRLLVDDSSLRCVFPCEGNERPSQGLSLSLSSTNPTSIGLQSFELISLRQNSTTHNNNDHDDDMIRFIGQEGFLGKAVNLHHHHNNQGQQFHLMRSSKYLDPAQELLNEFCSLGTKQIDASKQKQTHNHNHWEDDNSRKQSLYSLDFMELHKRKTKLLSMLEEVDRRYRHYRDQMKGVVSSFEAVAGIGAASVYSALASKAMSRHFKCLRDGIVGQIQATKKALGEKDHPVATPGTTRGETPRLRILDQTLRQQRAFQQMGMMESHPYRPQRGLPERSVSVLRAWLFEHFLHPYPSDVDKHVLARQTGLSRSQVSNWFINARVRLWKPMVEEMYVEESKEQENNMACSDGVTELHGDDNGGRPNQNIPLITDQKPTPDQLVRVDSECLSSIITSPDHENNARNSTSGKTVHHQNQLHLHHHQQSFGAAYGTGAIELDFSSYTAATGGSSNYGSTNNQHGNNQSFNGGGVSLTLGLQQHAGHGNGVSLAFSPAAASQSSLFYPRDHVGDQYSVLDGDQGQHLPYRNLMGAQLLHDLAG